MKSGSVIEDGLWVTRRYIREVMHNNPNRYKRCSTYTGFSIVVSHWNRARSGESFPDGSTKVKKSVLHAQVKYPTHVSLEVLESDARQVCCDSSRMSVFQKIAIRSRDRKT